MRKLDYKIKEIIVYPIKGMKGVSLPSTIVEQQGLQHDRRWMLINEENIFMSQRQHINMSAFVTYISYDHLIVKYDNDELRIPFQPSSNENIDAIVWGNEVQGLEVSQEISKWFSAKLKTTCKLIKLVDHSRVKQIDAINSSTSVSFADGYPILILGTASVLKLNEFCPEIIDANRFRANIIIETNKAHEEDNWKIVRNNHFKIQNIKPCVRCQVINIDQENGTAGIEPTKTLASYRRTNEGIIFGSNAICINEGKVGVGDVVYVDL
jgi:uncharacterized protein